MPAPPPRIHTFFFFLTHLHTLCTHTPACTLHAASLHCLLHCTALCLTLPPLLTRRLRGGDRVRDLPHTLASEKKLSSTSCCAGMARNARDACILPALLLPIPHHAGDNAMNIAEDILAKRYATARHSMSCISRSRGKNARWRARINSVAPGASLFPLVKAPRMLHTPRSHLLDMA